MFDLNGEPAPLTIDNVPRERATQLRRTHCVGSPSCIFLAADVGNSPTVTRDEHPHCYGLRWIRPQRFTACSGVLLKGSIVILGGSLHWYQRANAPST
jgi:hypothetical protein